MALENINKSGRKDIGQEKELGGGKSFLDTSFLDQRGAHR